MLRLCTWLACWWVAWLQAPPALSQAPYLSCPPELLDRPEKCERFIRRQGRKQERERQKAQDEAYREAHPWRVSAVAQGDVFIFGLGQRYVASFWGVAGGASLRHQLSPRLALRVDGLARFGRGHIDSWGMSSGGPIRTGAGSLAGAALHTSLQVRIGVLYIGPVLSLGLVHLHGQVLHESDYGNRYTTGSVTVRVPHDAAFLAAGLAIGGETQPDGRIGVAARFTPGLWHDLRHLYVDLALTLSVKLWD